MARLEARFAWVMTILTGGGLATVVAFGAHQVLAGALSAGTLVVFAQYMKDLQSPLNTLSRLWAKLAKVAVRAERIMEVFDERPAVEERPGAKTAPLPGEVRFEGVSFGYDRISRCCGTSSWRSSRARWRRSWGPPAQERAPCRA